MKQLDIEVSTLAKSFQICQLITDMQIDKEHRRDNQMITGLYPIKEG